MGKRSILALLLAVVGLVAFGTAAGLSQEEEPDVCQVVFEPEEEWSAQAYAYCTMYCVEVDCDGAPAEENVNLCLSLLDQYADATEGRIPPCEPTP